MREVVKRKITCVPEVSLWDTAENWQAVFWEHSLCCLSVCLWRRFATPLGIISIIDGTGKLNYGCWCHTLLKGTIGVMFETLTSSWKVCQGGLHAAEFPYYSLLFSFDSSAPSRLQHSRLWIICKEGTAWEILNFLWFTSLLRLNIYFVFNTHCVLCLVNESCVRLLPTPQAVAHQAPLSMGLSRQAYWSGLPFCFSGELPDPGIKPGSPVIWADSLLSEPPGKPLCALSIIIKMSYAHKTLKELKIFDFINWLFSKYCAWVETSQVIWIFIKFGKIGCMNSFFLWTWQNTECF